jgi:hypothetical protein
MMLADPFLAGLPCFLARLPMRWGFLFCLARKAFQCGGSRSRHAVGIYPSPDSRRVDFEGGSHFSLPPSLSVKLLSELNEFLRLHSQPLE